jgi:hypothetical protein
VISTSAETSQSTVIATRPGEVVFVALTGGGPGYLAQTVTPRHVPEDVGRAAITGLRMTGTEF